MNIFKLFKKNRMQNIFEKIEELPLEIQLYIASMDFETFLILIKKNFNLKCLISYYCKFFKLEINNWNSLIYFYNDKYIQDFGIYTKNKDFIYRPYLKNLIISSNLTCDYLYLLSPQLETLKISKNTTLNEKWRFLKVHNLYLKCNDMSMLCDIFPNLKVLTCMDTTIFKLPNSLKILSLNTLTLSNCNLDYFPDLNLNSLEKIDLSFNNLTFFSGRYKNLKVLNLTSNVITSIDISECKKLTTLNIQANFLSFLDIDNCNLKYLNASYNNIMYIYLSTPSLKNLNLTSNELTEISSNNVKSYALKILDVSVNSIYSLEDMRFYNLKELDISDNNISYIDDLPNSLSILRLEYNPLYYIHEQCFDNVKYITGDYSQIYVLDCLRYSLIDIVDDYVFEMNPEMYD